MARLLLVHGDATVAKKTARALEAAGHEVVVETLAHRAWRRIRADTPDILVVSLSPNENPGMDAVSAVKNNRFAALPMVFYDVPDRLRDQVRRGFPQARIVDGEDLVEALARA